MMSSKTTAIVLAAGQGKRMNTPVAKQFLELKGKPVLYYSLKAFEESVIDEIVLVCSRSQIDYCREHIVNHYGFKKVRSVIEGGRERYESVYQSLAAIDRTDYVLIHDGARPFISSSLINQVVKLVRDSKACLVATPVKDTIKIVNQDGRIQETPDRNTLWSAQTPQAFEYSSIKKAYELLYSKDKDIRQRFTDDAMVYEKLINKPISIVEGDYTNIKLTTSEDYVLASILADKLF